MTDPIADMFIRIKNGINSRQEEVIVPYSIIKEKLLNILVDEGYIKKFEIATRFNKKIMRVFIKYRDKKTAVISELKRVSRCGRRVYKDCRSLKRVQGGFGTAIVSTSKGIMTDDAARANKVGGEVLCLVW